MGCHIRSAWGMENGQHWESPNIYSLKKSFINIKYLKLETWLSTDLSTSLSNSRKDFLFLLSYESLGPEVSFS